MKLQEKKHLEASLMFLILIKPELKSWKRKFLDRHKKNRISIQWMDRSGEVTERL